ncbi:MAG: hypothetical protein G01um101449_560 [Parcubacteria group bacterium Gr01-1014_49]|nr:MAG: hypothetical protein G01um101449_560 [Parcubacteria group bacterium Gr01-1014_49]
MSERLYSAPQGSDRLAVRRRRGRRRAIIAIFVLLILLCSAVVYGLWQPAVRISHVEIQGADESFATIAKEDLQGSYFGIIPRDSIFFFPANRIRADILAAHPGFAAISISRSSLTSLSIKTDERVAIARWCGLAPTPGVEPYCYVFDASGIIFAAAATTTQTINAFIVYAPLEGATEEPLRASIAQAHLLPTAFDFARQLSTLGSPVIAIVFRNDEVDDYFENETRLTYVLGHEQNAYAALMSARANLNIGDGSVEYVDLRFDGKIYLKKKK